MPPETNGQATGEGRPQLSPAMIESCGPGRSIRCPPLPSAAHKRPHRLDADDYVWRFQAAR